MMLKKSSILLETKNLTKSFGGIHAVEDVSLHISKAMINALIGPNGAGKTTLFNCITGFYPPTNGRMIFNGEDITGLKPHQISEAGMARTFQNIRLFAEMTVMENVLGIPIHYGIRIDFRGFTQAIDALGGIDVEVDRSFDDFNYPLTGKENDLCGFEEKEIDFTEEEAGKLNIPVGKRKVFVKDDFIATDSAEEDKGPKYFSCRYEHIKFTKGQMHMDGELALKFVRSRHGTSGESSDFARSKRQQKVLEAVRTKVLSLDTLTDPQKVKDLISALGKSIDTDISFDALEFYKLSKDIKSTQNIVIDDSLLIHPNSSNYGGAYVLISQDDDFSTIHDYIRKVLSGEITEYEATSSARGR